MAYGLLAPFVHAAAVLVMMPGTVPGTASEPRSAAGSEVVADRRAAALVSTATLSTVYERTEVVVSRRTRVSPLESQSNPKTPSTVRAGYGSGSRAPIALSVAVVIRVVTVPPVPPVRPGTGGAASRNPTP
nr:hypothetical protein [Amnibacterium sp.]